MPNAVFHPTLQDATLSRLRHAIDRFGWKTKIDGVSASVASLLPLIEAMQVR